MKCHFQEGHSPFAILSTQKFTAGKVVSILEGGYDLNALAESSNQHVKALLEFN